MNFNQEFLEAINSCDQSKPQMPSGTFYIIFSGERPTFRVNLKARLK